jgi:transposase
MTYEEAVVFCKNSPEVAATILMRLERLEEDLFKANAEIKRLQDIIGKDSSNSSKPPSTDNKLTKKANNKKSASKKSRGGQYGHSGRTLKMVEDPDSVVVLETPVCSCGHDLRDVRSSRVIKRQSFDLPEIRMMVTQFEQHTKVCPSCSSVNTPDFAENVAGTTQYGDNLRSFIAYCNTYQMIPYDRISEMIEDLTSHRLSNGTIYNTLKSYYDKLETYEETIKVLARKEAVLNCDETGVNVKGDLHWMHTVSSSVMTYYMLHKKRGTVAMDAMEILPEYEGIAVHDHWSPYNKYSCSHSFCNAHHLRELDFISQSEKVLWSENMHILLNAMNQEVNKAKEKGKKALSADKAARFSHHYDAICNGAMVYYPPPDKKAKKTRGRLAQPKGKNLLDRFAKYKDEVLRFSTDFNVPFTNNLAERDLRMIKVKEKISGTFASLKGGKIFARIRGYISTLKKNDRPVLKELNNVLSARPYLPVVCRC